MSINAQGLSVEDKLRLVEDLWDSIAADQNPLKLSDTHRALLDRREARTS